jgi:hypothetical protein
MDITAITKNHLPANSMQLSHTVQEIALVIAIRNHDPLVVGEAFLKQAEIVNPEWQLARQPYLSPQTSQLVFDNGISIVAETERVIFAQALGEKAVGTIEIDSIASKYASILKKADYQAVGINFRSFIPQPTYEDTQAYISQQLLAPASWQQVGETPVRAKLDLNFTISGRELSLNIHSAAVQFPEREPMPVILFGGSFSYPLDPTNKLERLTQILSNWQTDLTDYRNLVDRHFLLTGNSKGYTIGNDEPEVKPDEQPSLVLPVTTVQLN